MEFREQVKSTVDIIKVAGEYMRLTRVGAAGRYRGLCPFHTEKTPSFWVHQDKQYYKCFGCQKGGDVFSFLMEIESLSFWEALKLLAERNGIPLPKRTDVSDERTKLRAALYEMHEIALRVFQQNLRAPSGGEARAYLERRGISGELVNEFALGYSDAGGQELARLFEQKGYTQQQMEESGLVRRRESGGYYDSFRGRLMFPIHNETGKVIAFGGRALRDADEPKYLNSQETPIYFKKTILYNLHRARNAMRKSDRAVLVEGYIDVIGVYAAGVHEVVASCGTALSNEQVRVIRRHSENIVVNFDPDNAGANSTERYIQMLLEESMRVRILGLDGGLDPDEYVKQRGVEAYRAKLDKAGSYFHWMADRARTKFDMRSAEGRSQAFQFLLPPILRVTDKLERQMIASDLASYLGVDNGAVLEQFRRAAGERRAVPPSVPQAVPIPHSERILLRAVVNSAEIRAAVSSRLEAIVETLALRRIFEALLADPSFEELEGRLSESDRALLHQVFLADEMGEDTFTLAEAEQCLDRLENDAFNSRTSELRARVKAAEREGNLEEAIRLMTELNELMRRRPPMEDRGGADFVH